LNIKNYLSVAKTNNEISNVVSKSIENGYTSLVLGGDHSIGLGSLHGTLSSIKNQLGLIWIDAHCDINTPLTSPSGNFHGQPLSFLVKEMIEGNEVPKLKEFDWIKSYISARNIVYLGLRDVDPDEL
jgi:arginase